MFIISTSKNKAVIFDEDENMQREIVPLYSITFEPSGPIINKVMSVDEGLMNETKYRELKPEFFTWTECKEAVINYYLKKVEILYKQTEDDYFTFKTFKNTAARNVYSMIEDMENSVEDGVQALVRRRAEEVQNSVEINSKDPTITHLANGKIVE